LTCVPDTPQGSPKKIHFHLLAADRAFQFGDPPLGRRVLRRRYGP
jgi:hypothetical protein